MRAFVRCAVVSAVLGAACLPPADAPSSVHDLRIAAMRAEPPEIIVPVVRDGTSVKLEPRGLAGLPSAVKLSALVLDPTGKGREVRYRFTTCPWAGDLRCEGRTTEIRLAEGLLKGDTAEAELALLKQETLDLLLAAQKQDPLKGFGGLPLVVTLHVTAGAEEVFAGKRVVFTFPQVPGQTANINPRPPDVLLNGLLLLEGDRPLVSRSPAPRFDVFPVEDSAKEEYVVPTFDGGSRKLRESFRYSFFTTQGRFAPNRTGGADPVTRVEAPTEAKLTLVEGEPTGDFTVYVVVRDGRGGETWSRRTATSGGAQESGR